VRGHPAAVPQETTVRVAHYLTRDRLGSTRELVNASETVMTRYDYDIENVSRATCCRSFSVGPRVVNEFIPELHLHGPAEGA